MQSRWTVLVGALLAIAITGAALAAHPDAPRTPGAAYLPIVLGVVLTGYALIAATLLRRPRDGDRTGVWLGVAAGLMWSAEITGGGPVYLSRAAEVANGTTFEIAALVTTVAAGVAIGAVRGPQAALRGGVLAGLVSGEVAFGYGITMTLAFLGRLGARADYQQQFANSHAPNMPAFLVQDALAGYGAHLFINPLLGLVGVGIGALVGLAVRGRSQRAAIDRPQ